MYVGVIIQLSFHSYTVVSPLTDAELL